MGRRGDILLWKFGNLRLLCVWARHALEAAQLLQLSGVYTVPFCLAFWPALSPA